MPTAIQALDESWGHSGKQNRHEVLVCVKLLLLLGLANKKQSRRSNNKHGNFRKYVMRTIKQYKVIERNCGQGKGMGPLQSIESPCRCSSLYITEKLNGCVQMTFFF